MPLIINGKKIDFYQNYFLAAFSCKRLVIFLVILLSFFSISNSFATEEFSPKPQEERAHNLFLQIKCLVCKGQVIENSDAQIAFDLRQLIRDKISQGATDKEIKDFLIKDYGAGILTSPPLNQETLFLWLAPVVFLILGIFVLFIYHRRK